MGLRIAAVTFILSALRLALAGHIYLHNSGTGERILDRLLHSRISSDRMPIAAETRASAPGCPALLKKFQRLRRLCIVGEQSMATKARESEYKLQRAYPKNTLANFARTNASQLLSCVRGYEFRVANEWPSEEEVCVLGDRLDHRKSDVLQAPPSMEEAEHAERGEEVSGARADGATARDGPSTTDSP
ncbi:hypothetical protein DFH06DRAFT_1296743 [Mycena polygramma]|nr:hypothetical protein DFH06DRAFT_1296743 [Mycena polygramma]